MRLNRHDNRTDARCECCMDDFLRAEPGWMTPLLMRRARVKRDDSLARAMVDQVWEHARMFVGPRLGRQPKLEWSPKACLMSWYSPQLHAVFLDPKATVGEAFHVAVHAVVYQIESEGELHGSLFGETYATLLCPVDRVAHVLYHKHAWKTQATKTA